MQCEIGVIGNGAIGKAAALGFAQAGLRVVLLCPSEQTLATRQMLTEWDARVFALNHTAQNLLSKLKVWDALDLQRVSSIESMKVFDVGATNTDSALSLDAYTAYQQELAWIVEDQNLNQALDAALRFTPNVTIMVGKAIAMSADFSELTLNDGTSMRAQLWVGADGAQSWIRNQAQIGLNYRSYHQSGVVANFRSSKPHHGVAYQWFAGEHGIIALLPLAGHQVSLVWSAPDELAASLLSEDAHQLVQRLSPYCADIFGELTPLPPQRVRAFPLQLMSPHKVIGPKLALVGDAAHVVHPLAGHGMNLGFADVTALLEVVTQREAWCSCGDVRVLQRYARARKEDVVLMQLVTDGLARLFGSPWVPAQTVRRLGMNLVNHLPFFKRQLMWRAIGGSQSGKLGKIN